MDEKQIQFVRELHTKYGINLTPEKEQKALELFNRDFDGSLSAFYTKFNPEKEITPDFIGKIKNTYGFSQPEVIPPLDTTSEDMSFGQSIMNSAKNTVDAISAIPQDFIAGNMGIMGWVDKQISKTESFLPKEYVDAARKGYSYLSWLPQLVATGEVSDNVNEAIGKMAQISVDKTKDALPTKEFVKSVEQGDIAGIVAGAVNGFMGYIPSLIVGAATKGVGFVPYFAGGGIVTSAEAKSEEQGISMQELFENNEAEYIVPLAVGGLAGQLEKYGLKKLGQSLVANLTNSGMDSIKKMVVSGGQQAFINWVEAGMHKFVEDYSKESTGGSDIEKDAMASLNAGLSAGKYLLSEEGVNAAAEAGLGTLLMGGLGKAGNAGFRRVTGKNAVEAPITPEEAQKKALESAETKGEESYMKIVKGEETSVEEVAQAIEEIRDVDKKVPESKLNDEELSNKIDSIITDFKSQTEKEKILEKEKKDLEKLEKAKEESKKIEQKESKVNESHEDGLVKEVAKNVKDLASLSESIYKFFGMEKTKENVEKVSKISKFIDKIAESRSRREGIGKSEWYQSRVESIGSKKEDGSQTGAMTNFLTDGRAVIRALEAPTPRDFFRQFGKVLYRDLNEQEAGALRNEFGVDIANMSEESEAVFLDAFDSYLQRGAMPSSVKGANKSIVEQAFAKIAEWLRDIKAAVDGSSMYINPSVAKIFDSIVTATDIQQENAQTITEEVAAPDGQGDTRTEGTGETIAGATKEGLNEKPEKPVLEKPQDGRNKKEGREKGSELSSNKKEEIIDLTETQEEVTNEQSTTKIDGKKSKSDAKTASEGEQTTKRATPKPKGKRSQSEQKQINENDALIERSTKFTPRKKSTGELYGTDASNINRTIAKINSALSNENTTPAQEKALNREKKRLEKVIKENEEQAKLSKEVKDKSEKSKADLIKAGVSKTQAEAFTRKEGNVDVLSYEDGFLTYTKDGEIFETELKSGDTVAGKTAVEKAKNQRVKEAKSDAREREVQEKLNKEEEAAISKIEQAINYAVTTTSRPINDIKAIFKRILYIDFSALNTKSVSMNKDEFSSILRRRIDKFVSEALNKKTPARSFREYYEEFKGSIQELLTKENLLNGSDKEAIRETLVKANNAMEDYERGQILKDKKIKEKEEGVAKELKGTMADPSAPQVTSLYAPKTYTNIISRLASAFGIKSKFMVIDLSRFDETAPVNKGKTAEEIDLERDKERPKLFAIFNQLIFEGESRDSLLERYDADIVKKNEEMIKDLVEKILYPNTIKGRKTKSRFRPFQQEIASSNESFNDYIIAFSTNTSIAEAANSLLHEFGHVTQEELLKNAPKEVIDSIDKEFNEWLEKKNKSLSFNLSNIKDIFFLRNPITSLLSRADIKDSVVGLKGKERKNAIKKRVREYVKYSESFSEYWADQVAYWLETNEKPKTLTGKFFKQVVASIKKILDMFNFEYNTSNEIAKFLDKNFQLRDKGISNETSFDRANAVRDASSVQYTIDGIDRLIYQKMSELEALNGKISIEGQVTPEMISNIAKEKKAKREALQKEINRLNRRKESEVTDLQVFYETYVNLGGKMSEADFNKEISIKAKEQYENYIAREANKAFYNPEASVISDPKGISASNPSGNRPSLYQQLAKAIDGKFKNRDEFNSIIKKINESLKNNGLTQLTKQESEDIFDNTSSGISSKIKAPLFVRYSTKKREDLKEIIDSMDATEAERSAAQAVIEEILQGVQKVMEFKGQKIPATRVKLIEEMRKKYKGNLNEVSQLEMVGLNRSSIQEMRRIHAEGHANAIISEQKSKVAAEAAKYVNENRITSDVTALVDLFGAKKEGDGFRTTLKGKSIIAKIYDITKSYKAGDILYSNGDFYAVKSDSAPGTSLSSDSISFIQAIKSKDTKPTLDKKSFITGAKRFVGDMFLSSHGFESLIARIADKSDSKFFDSGISKLFGEKGFRLAGKRARDDFYQGEDLMDDLVKKIFGVKTNKEAKEKLYDARTTEKKITYTDNQGKKQTQSFYISQLMDYYAALKQKDLAKRFDAMSRLNLNGDDAKFWNASKQAAVIDAIPSEYKALVDSTVDNIMPVFYKKINSTYRKRFGYDLISLENYFPVTGEISGSKTTELEIETQNAEAFLASVSNNNLKDRGRGGTIEAGDFVSKYYSYISRASHYTHYAQPVAIASRLFGANTKYGRALKEMYGESIMKHINWNLDNIAANSATNYVRNNYVDMLRGMSIAGAFMANITMIPKQISSFAAYADSMPTGQWISYYTKMLTNPKQIVEDFKTIRDMNFIKERLSQGGRTNLDSLHLMIDSFAGEINKPKGLVTAERASNMVKDILFYPTKAGDVGAIYIGGMAYVRYLKEEAKKKFPSDSAKQKEWMEVKFEESTSRTQQSRAMLDAGKHQTTSSVNSLFITFMSTPMLYGRILNGGYRDIARGIEKKNPELVRAGAKRVALFGFVLPYMFLSASSGSLGFFFDEDEDEEKKSILQTTIAYGATAAFQHVPILYPILQNMIDRKYLNKEFDLTIVPTLGILEKAIEGGESIVERYNEDGLDFSDEALWKDIAKVGRGVGINISAGQNLYNAWSDPEAALSEDWRLLFGYSPYAIGLEQPGNTSKIK